MIFGLGVFSFGTFANITMDTIEIADSIKLWNEICPMQTEWVEIEPRQTSIRRCTDAT